MTAATYAALAAKFDHTFKDVRGGVELDYLTGEQVISRLNNVLGPLGWSFQVAERGYIEDTDEEWVWGRLTVYTADGPPVVREQFGSQKRNKRRDGSHIEIGMDMKGAATDALKKCATLIGVGLYLSEKEGGYVRCQECGDGLETVRLTGNRTSTVEEQARLGREKFGKVVCIKCGMRLREAEKANGSQAE